VTDLIWLDDAGCLDARTCGDKAARLARARGHGFPVLPGFVLPATASREVLEHAVTTTDTGVFGARLTVMDSDVAALAPAVEAARQLAASVVVRSSSPVEGSGRWAGAFSSFIGVPPEDVPTAVRGVWSSAIVARRDEDDALAVDTKTPERVEMAVLVQPEVTPELSGTARVEPDGSVSVVSTEGAPAALVAGWTRGTTSRVDRSGDIGGDETDPARREIIARVAALANELRGTTGDDIIEWAAADGDILLLQCRHDEDAAPPKQERPAGVPGLLPVARVAHAFAGPLGEQLVLPWLLTGDHAADVFSAAAAAPTAAETAPLFDTWRLTRADATALAARVWAGKSADPADATQHVLRELQGPAPVEALAALVGLPAADAAAARHLLTAFGRLAGALTRLGVLRSPNDLWLLEPGKLTALLSGAQPDNLDLAQRARRAALRFEPLLFAALVTDGRSVSGTPAAPGIGAGPRFVADAADAPAHAPARSVVVARYPLPRFAPLLWSASGLVTAEGSEGAHLIEVARSLGVPAVVGCSEGPGAGLPDAALVAVDGERGTVSFDVR
jgi:phosphohistidine swiveling domain-containing protein